MEFQNGRGETLAAILDWPTDGSPTPKGVVVFAHCFTCSKDFPAIFRIAKHLEARGFAVLRFDFTGLGASSGDFADTNFSSNVDDLIAAVNHVTEVVGAPDILMGHSLGGLAALSAAGRVPDLKGVVTIAAPSEAHHLSHLLEDQFDTLEAHGEVEIEVGGRHFTIRKHFLEDIRNQAVLESLREFTGSLLVLHSPEDETVGIEHAGEIYRAAHHPKSFISLAGADHTLTRRSDSEFAGEMIASWAKHLCLD